MRRTVLLTAMVTTAAAAAASSTASVDAVALIRPGISIGKISLGMTQAEVRRAVGRPQFVVRRRGAFGVRTVEYQYGYGSYTARFAVRAGRYRVVRVGTTLVRERTRTGVGPGTREARLIRSTPALRCQPLETQQHGSVRLVVGDRRDCTLAAPGGRRTIFTTSVVSTSIWDPLEPSDWARRAEVIEVSVALAS